MAVEGGLSEMGCWYDGVECCEQVQHSVVYVAVVLIRCVRRVLQLTTSAAAMAEACWWIGRVTADAATGTI